MFQMCVIPFAMEIAALFLMLYMQKAHRLNKKLSAGEIMDAILHLNLSSTRKMFLHPTRCFFAIAMFEVFVRDESLHMLSVVE